MDLLRTGPASNQLIEYPSRVIFAFLRKELLSWAIWKLDSMSDSYHCTGSVQTFTFWAFIFSCGRALLYITVFPTGYHIIQLLRFLREVEIFFKRLRKGWIVVHTFIDRFLQRYNLAMWLSIAEARSYTDCFSVATPKIMRLINKDFFSTDTACKTPTNASIFHDTSSMTLDVIKKRIGNFPSGWALNGSQKTL